MKLTPPDGHRGFRLAFPCGMLVALLLLLASPQHGGGSQSRSGNPDFLIENWLEDDGLPESSAYAIAQTPDGYLWVGTAYGVFRYNGIDFQPAGRGINSPIMTDAVESLYVDHSGRLWASAASGVAVRENGVWRTIPSHNTLARSLAQDASGQVFLGTYDGRLFTIETNALVTAAIPPDLAASDVFCVADARDGHLWLANQGFIGRLSQHRWQRCGPPESSAKPLLATGAHAGGLWVYSHGTLTKYDADGTTKTFLAPDIDQPRLLLEDREGAIWLASASKGYWRLRPGGTVLATVSADNGLVHNSAACLFQDLEGNFWLGSRCGGLCRLEPRIFHTIGLAEGLPTQIVRTIGEESPGQMIIGTHGGGTVQIQNGKVIPRPTDASNPEENYAWSILHDHAGRTWIGTYGQGLWVKENGVDRIFPLPTALGKTVSCLLEDSHHRIWVGTGSGLGMIDDRGVTVESTKSPFAGRGVWGMAEDARSGALWIGTINAGLYRCANHAFTHFGAKEGLPADRISSLLLDREGDLWIGLYQKGLACLHGGKISLVGRNAGFPASTPGFMLEDGLDSIWFGTDHGILRASEEQLHQLIAGRQKTVSFAVFDTSDGLYAADCSAGYQPAALRDEAGVLWLATMNGVVTVDPAKICLNTNPPPVVLESFSYKDMAGKPHLFLSPGPGPFELPAGSQDLHIDFAALSYSAPEKNHYAYRLEGFNDDWVPLGNHRQIYFHMLPPGRFRLQLKGSNNDDTWNEDDNALNLKIKPHFWVTWWFWLFLLLGVAAVAGLAAWRITLERVRDRIARLEQQRALDQERARLATVMEATGDLVAFADNSGRVLHLNPAGRRLLGLTENQSLAGLTLAQMHPPAAAAWLNDTGIPTARIHGICESEIFLRHRDGREIPCIETIMAHQGTKEDDSFLSTIARDITEQKLAKQASERLQAQLLQAQKMESVGRLAGGIAHDFNNMLQVIIGNADMALENAPPDSDLRAELLEIQKSANRSAELTSQLLTFARKQVFRAQELSLGATVAGTSKMLQRLIGENIKLALNCADDLWPVRLDPSQITQILTNLAINARDAIDGQGQLTITLANVILPQDDMVVDEQVVPGEYVMLSVRDNGHGMTPEILGHLFEPFFTTKEVGKGTGLGLATVFGIIKQNRGFIQVDSAPGQGSTFRIYFPRSNSTLMNTTTPSAIHTPLHGTETIMIVEDEENILQMILLTLRKHGYHVIAAPVPDMALIMAASHPGKIDLLVTDIVMPGMNGKQLQEKLSVIQPDMKSLFMSGYTAEIIAQHGDLEEGLNFLQKPFTIHNFLERVRKTLDAH